MYFILNCRLAHIWVTKEPEAELCDWKDALYKEIDNEKML